MEEFIRKLILDSGFIAPILFILIRALAIVIPPIPGLAIDAAGIIVFGWLPAFIYAETGIMLGAMTAFLLTRKYKGYLLNRFVSLKNIEHWEKLLSNAERFWSLVAIRLPSNFMFDYISYAAGLTRIKPITFFSASLIGNVPSVLITFLIGEKLNNKGSYYLILAIVSILILGFLFKRRFK